MKLHNPLLLIPSFLVIGCRGGPGWRLRDNARLGFIIFQQVFIITRFARVGKCSAEQRAAGPLLAPQVERGAWGTGTVKSASATVIRHAHLLNICLVGAERGRERNRGYHTGGVEHRASSSAALGGAS